MKRTRDGVREDVSEVPGQVYRDGEVLEGTGGLQ